jgi:hypothetical protein
MAYNQSQQQLEYSQQYDNNGQQYHTQSGQGYYNQPPQQQVQFPQQYDNNGQQPYHTQFGQQYYNQPPQQQVEFPQQYNNNGQQDDTEPSGQDEDIDEEYDLQPWLKFPDNKKSSTQQLLAYAPPPDIPENGFYDLFRSRFEKWQPGLEIAMQEHRVDNSWCGKKKTVFPKTNSEMDARYAQLGIRYDCEKTVTSNSDHPSQLTYANYMAQANSGRHQHPILQGLANRNNGAKKAPAANEEHYRSFGGSTIASVNVEMSAQPPPADRVAAAVMQSARWGPPPLYVLSSESNNTHIPARIRQESATYHGDPMAQWPERSDPRNPFHGANSNGTLPAGLQFYQYNPFQ